ncbi:putative CPSF-domain protein [Leishmania mexicana MHOM/GT/2001/U1103]|uniref:CPSF-domain protein n=1 Tax=Leishmania mexicana (strain MHOM/GT/2001/U1103) TaxID=929439 RepID=E9B1E5_LEIMU|nr:putative CPSF-domain protein [Leishmania mexicana MHOM/GT/2001/U1103]CBZ29051.1 putative CPSF-domain protein [Leishmania mexicana MHOM/GT/2001/U1103]
MYVLSTSRPSTAAFGAAVGNFCGDGTTYVALNRGTLLSLYVLRQGNSGIDHVQDFRLHCTLKYVRPVLIVDSAAPQKCSRHLLFLCTVKQQIVLAALETSTELSRGASPLRMTTLFQGAPGDCLYQYDPGDVELCCCSSAVAGAGGSPPFVVFALTRGELFVFDCFAALARDAVKRKQNGNLTRLLSPELMTSVARRAKADIFSHCYMDCAEYDVRDISFGFPSPWLKGQVHGPAPRPGAAAMRGDNAPASTSLFVLYGDPYGKVHVSEYELAVSPVAEAEAASETSSVESSIRQPARPPPYPAEFGTPTRRVRRCGLLQANVDPTASRIVPSRHGLFVVGNHLVTLIQQVRPRKGVLSREIPSRQAILDVSCASVSADASELVIGFSDGVLARVTVISRGMGSEDPELAFRFLSHPAPTIPTEMVTLHADLYLLCSRFDSSFTVRLDEASCEEVLRNCGPVLDMTTHQNGSRYSVVASTGIHRGGGISVLRSAVMLRDQADIPLHCHPQRVLCAGELMCITMAAAANRFFFVSTRALTLEELAPHMFPEIVSRHPLVELGLDAALDRLVLISVRGITWLRLSGPRVEAVSKLPRQDDDPQILFAVVRHGVTVVCDGSVVTVYRGQEVVHTVPPLAGVAISAVSLVSPTLLVVGQWNGVVALYELGRRQAVVVGRLLLDSVPRTIACAVPPLSPSSMVGEAALPIIYVGTLHGFLVETTVALLRRGETSRSVFVAPHPLELQELAGPHAGLLCLGHVPLVVLYLGGGGLQLTGLHLMGVSAAATVDADLQCYAFYSRQDGRLHIGSLEALEKTSRTFLPLGETITQLHETAAWGGYAASVRKVEGDEVLFLPSTAIQFPWAADLTLWRSAAVPLLENERCVFLQTVRLDGAEGGGSGERGGEQNDAAAGGSGGVSKEEWQQLLLIGSSFTFPDEQRARSGRITWCALREEHQRQRLHLIASKDIGGALQCCAAVPHYKGRIALGVNGCVCLYNWNTEDQTFVAEERCRIGLTVTKLIPLYDTSLAASVLVALDVRHSAFFIEVDTLQGSLKVLCRDADLRGVMDGHIGSDAENLCLFDDSLNFTAMKVVPLPVEAGDGDAAAAGSVTAQYRFEVRAQCHLGDLVTCVRPGCFAATSLMEAPAACSLSRNRLLLPGIAGPQLVFATAHGGFGVVTPVQAATYLVLRALEASLVRTLQPVGGLSHQAFREVLRAGQERGVSYLASKTGCALTRERLRRYEPLNTVDGDMVELFVQLPPSDKKHICRVATEVFLHAFAHCLNESGTFVAPPAKEEQCVLGAVGTAMRPFAQYPEKTIAQANAFLYQGGLPHIPFAAEAVEQQVMNLQRAH